jgi:xylulose-5-phosphate/fructose-6-phosphate phosphoketolase
MEQAIIHCTQGIGIWDWASNDQGAEPDVVMACCGDTPTLETLAAVTILRKHFPELKIRVVNVVDLMRLQPDYLHPHGLSEQAYDAIFTVDKPIVFAFHGYPSLIHELTYKRKNRNIHVRGYKEEGTITTAFDMRVQNEIDRFHLVMLALYHIDLGNRDSYLIQLMKDTLVKHKLHIARYGTDLPEVADWKWTAAEFLSRRRSLRYASNRRGVIASAWHLAPHPSRYACHLLSGGGEGFLRRGCPREIIDPTIL